MTAIYSSDVEEVKKLSGAELKGYANSHDNLPLGLSWYI